MEKEVVKSGDTESINEVNKLDTSIKDEGTKENKNNKENSDKDDNSIKTRKRIIRFTLLFILIVIVIWLLRGCGGCSKPIIPGSTDTKQGTSLDIAEDNEWDGTMSDNRPKASSESIIIPGYSDLYVSNEAKTIKLVNDVENTVYLQYNIYEGDSLVYESQAIKPGNMLEADLYSLFTQGEHELRLQINTFDVDTQQTCNGATQSVKITVAE